MGKWTCRCGQAMNDHKAPDPNAYSVYSDELFEEIFNNTDEHDRISYEDISVGFLLYVEMSQLW